MPTIPFDDLVNMPVTDLPAKTLVDAFYDGTNYMNDFGREVMHPLLKSLLSPSPQEIAIRDTYYKMSLLLRSILALNRLDRFQTVASVTRSLFELWLDLIVLVGDATGDAVRRYNEFPEIERYRVAEQLIKFSNSKPQALRMDISAQRAFHDDPQRGQRIASLAPANTKGRHQYPDHWTGKNVRQRAIDSGQEQMYVEAYFLLSWYVHAGATGTAGMSRETFRAALWPLSRSNPKNVCRCNRKMR
jgi:hypothetical protein